MALDNNLICGEIYGNSQEIQTQKQCKECKTWAVTEVGGGVIVNIEWELQETGSDEKITEPCQCRNKWGLN